MSLPEEIFLETKDLAGKLNVEPITDDAEREEGAQLLTTPSSIVRRLTQEQASTRDVCQLFFIFIQFQIIFDGISKQDKGSESE